MKMSKRLEIILKANFREFAEVEAYQWWGTSSIFKANGIELNTAVCRERYANQYSRKEIRRWNNGGRNAYIKALSRKLVAYNGGEYAREILARFTA